MSGKITNTSLYAQPYGDQDQATSAQQVPGVYQAPNGDTEPNPGTSIASQAMSRSKEKADSAESQFRAQSLNVDGQHGGINQTTVQADGAAGANSMTTHSSSAPTPEDMGFM